MIMKAPVLRGMSEATLLFNMILKGEVFHDYQGKTQAIARDVRDIGHNPILSALEISHHMLATGHVKEGRVEEANEWLDAAFDWASAPVSEMAARRTILDEKTHQLTESQQLDPAEAERIANSMRIGFLEALEEKGIVNAVQLIDNQHLFPSGR